MGYLPASMYARNTSVAFQTLVNQMVVVATMNQSEYKIISDNATEVNADGDPYLFGGGVYARGTILTIENCTINNNSMPPDLPSWILCQGGGVYASDATLIMRGCTLDGNASSDGSGLYYNGGNGVFAQHHALLERTRILNGHGDLETGAINANDADVIRLTEVEMSGNEHRGLYTRSCDTLRVDRCLFNGNGGGAHLLLMIGDNAFINSTFNGAALSRFRRRNWRMPLS